MAAPQHDLLFLLSHVSHALNTEMTAGLASLGITPRHQCVLSKAIDAELTQIRLAELCGLDKTTMVVTLDELERAGLAERRPSSVDRRARIVAVTFAGRSMVARAESVVAGVYRDVLGTLPAGERNAMLSGLDRLAHGRLAHPADCERPVRRRAVRV